MRAMDMLWSVIMVAVLSGYAGAGSRSVGDAEKQLCDIDFPFSVSVDPNAVRIGALHFTAAFGVSKGSFSFQNRSASEVSDFRAVIEFADARQQPIFNALFHAYVPAMQSLDSTSRAFDAEGAVQLDETIKSGQTKLWAFSTAFFSPACPAAAHASFISIKYVDGTSLQYSDAVVRREPVAVDASYLLPYSGSDLPSEVIASLKIDDKGIATLGQVRPESSAEFQQWLKSGIHQWEFCPAFLNSQAVASEITVVFRFHKSKPVQYPVPNNFPRVVGAFQVADVVPAQPGKRLWRVYLGRGIVSSKALPED